MAQLWEIYQAVRMLRAKETYWVEPPFFALAFYSSVCACWRRDLEGVVVWSQKFRTGEKLTLIILKFWDRLVLCPKRDNRGSDPKNRDRSELSPSELVDQFGIGTLWHRKNFSFRSSTFFPSVNFSLFTNFEHLSCRHALKWVFTLLAESFVHLAH